MMSAGQPVAHLGLKKQSITIVFSKLTKSAPEKFFINVFFCRIQEKPKEQELFV
jgi:hypothetical protein